jgi:hypothetical protein
MLQLTLTEEEQRLLREILENDLSDLRMEIRETDDRGFREMLKHNEELMKEILGKLQ